MSKHKPDNVIFSGDWQKLTRPQQAAVRTVHDQKHKSMLQTALEWEREQQNAEAEKENERYGYEHNKTDD